MWSDAGSMTDQVGDETLLVNPMHKMGPRSSRPDAHVVPAVSLSFKRDSAWVDMVNCCLTSKFEGLLPLQSSPIVLISLDCKPVETGTIGIREHLGA